MTHFHLMRTQKHKICTKHGQIYHYITHIDLFCTNIYHIQIGLKHNRSKVQKVTIWGGHFHCGSSPMLPHILVWKASPGHYDQILTICHFFGWERGGLVVGTENYRMRLNSTPFQLSVYSRTFGKKFYHLQQNYEQNLHLHIKSKIYNLQTS